jgi:TonB family protein
VRPPPRPRERAPKPAPDPPPPDPTPAPPAAAEETIADFSGTTLTNDAQGGWVSAVGNGASMDGPIGRAGAAVTGRSREGVAGGTTAGEGSEGGLRLVGENNLSRRPKLPAEDLLNRALERNYPKQARQQGIEGSARIKLRVLANGKLEPVRKDSESYPGFGDACMKALREVAQQGHRAEPPLDRQGMPAATEVRFDCTFTVE